MKILKLLGEILKWLLKLAFKLLMLALWAVGSITEAVIHQLNEIFKKLSKH